MLRAVGVPRRHGEQDHLFRAGPVVRRGQARQQRVILDHARLAPDLDAPARRVIDQEQMRLRILGQIAAGDVLAVAAEIREGQGLAIEHAQEACRAAAMLDIRLPGGARGAEEDAGLRADEGGELGRDLGLPAAILLHPPIARSRPLAALDRLDGGREGDVARDHGCCRHGCSPERYAFTRFCRS
jgi:hypothetical protein